MKTQSAKRQLFGIVVGLAGMFIATSASASLIGVKTMEISNAISQWLQVAEFQAFDLSNTNVALASAGATASSSSSWNSYSTADKAIDGNTNGVFTNQSVFHEGNASPLNRVGDTLVITLSGSIDLSSIKIFGRTDACCRARDVYNLDFLDVTGQSIFSLSSLDAAANSSQVSFSFPEASAVPEPNMLALFGVGLAALGLLRRRAVC